MKIFLTGASGFVGGAITEQFQHKYTIYAMARSAKSAEVVRSLGAVPVKCDLETISAHDMQDCDVVIHCAAFAEEWGSYEDFYKANVQGTQNLINAAREAGAKRFIFIGTEAALFHGQDMLEVTESYPYALNSPYPYSRTKALAEKIVLEADSVSMTTISLRPRMVWGPKDQSILPAVLEMIQKNQFAWIGGGFWRTSSTHVYNLVHAVELALTNGVGGNAYFITDDQTHLLREFLKSYIETQGVQVPTKSVPTWVARSLAVAIEWVWKVFKIKAKPPMVRFSIDIMSAHCTLRIDKAKRELGYHPVINTLKGLATMPKVQ